MQKKLNLEMIPSDYDISKDIIREDFIMGEECEEFDDEYADSEYEDDMEMDYGYLEDEEDEEPYYESIFY